MDKKPAQELESEYYRIYSLDRCLKCLCVLNLGQNTFCTVNLKKTRPAEPSGEAGAEKP